MCLEKFLLIRSSSFSVFEIEEILNFLGSYINDVQFLRGDGLTMCDTSIEKKKNYENFATDEVEGTNLILLHDVTYRRPLNTTLQT